jgi:hypothetical protein
LAEVFDLNGRKLAVLCNGEYVPAEYEISWNGTCSDGTQISPGIYICRVLVGKKSASSKLIKSR